MATISPDDGDAGSTTVKPPLVVLQKYPSPDTAVKPDVFIDVCQSTAPDLPNPVCVPLLVIVAPHATVIFPPEATLIFEPLGILIVSPLSPRVVVVPDLGLILLLLLHS